MRPFNQEIPLELGDGIEHVHGHRAGRTGEVRAAERETIDAYAHFGKPPDGGADVDRVAAEAVELCDDENVAGLQLVHEPGKAAALRDGGTARNRLGDNPARLDMKAGGFDFLNLVFGGLSGRGDADIGKGAWHGVNVVRIGCPKYRCCSKACQDNLWTGCFAPVRNRPFSDRGSATQRVLKE